MLQIEGYVWVLSTIPLNFLTFVYSSDKVLNVCVLSNNFTYRHYDYEVESQRNVNRHLDPCERSVASRKLLSTCINFFTSPPTRFFFFFFSFFSYLDLTRPNLTSCTDHGRTLPIYGSALPPTPDVVTEYPLSFHELKRRARERELTKRLCFTTRS
ncbi:hypothetical protein PUN28_004804 [Cardiocondyla obscurior]|uniref:Uncharacterized protein n=1 Tax=Cardiocondyla obscurior TaxID=286306 RepID=A0AAW2GHP5_9HYME